jgi:hypothetical protein
MLSFGYLFQLSRIPVTYFEADKRDCRASDDLLENSSNEVINVDRVISVGDEAQAIGTWSNTVQRPDGSTRACDGHFTSVMVLQGNIWKIRMNTNDQSRPN